MTDWIERAALKGRQFLISRQSEGGFWTDWQLPPGESTIWTTAYVGYRLAPFDSETASTALKRAAFWLRAHEFAEGGWGYREELGPDADSTALAILFLSSVGFSAPDRCFERLLAFQRADGGFATFLPPGAFGAWTAAHPEVTATAVSALLTRFGAGERCVARGVEWLLENTAPDGLWHSYWWDSRLYSIEASLAVVRRADEAIDADRALRALRAIAARNCFEQSLRIMSSAHLGHADEAGVSALVAAQDPDGGWPSSALLRLTDRACEDPWNREQAGPLFLDGNRIFTTATALAALAAARRRTAHTGEDR
ncbi:MAG TPA: hypothetical protein VKV74_16080 [Bryobacteraceae bacterium]|nr:hypothetical protein [Bryobacteraceae bacterium]